MGSWAREGERKDQIEEEGKVEHDEVEQNPTSPMLERAGSGREKQQHGGALGGSGRFVPETKQEERGEVHQVKVLTRAGLGLVDQSGPTRSARLSLLGQSNWIIVAAHFVLSNKLN
jgi:hypothetical protein